MTAEDGHTLAQMLYFLGTVIVIMIARSQIIAEIRKLQPPRIDWITTQHMVRKAGLDATLPTGYQYGYEAMENVTLGKRIATEAILNEMAKGYDT